MVHATDAPRSQWSTVTLAVLGGIVVALQVGKVPPAIPALRAELGLGLVEAGLVASLFALLGACSGVPLGALLNRRGPRLAMTAATAALACGAVLGALAQSGAGLLLARVLEGFGFVGIAVSAPRLIVLASLPRDRTLALGLWGTYMPIGMALAMLVGGPLVALAGWRWLWWLASAAALVYLLAFQWLGRRFVLAPEPPAAPLADSLRSAFRRPGPWLLAGCFGFYSLQFFAVATWLPTYLSEAAAFSASGAAQWTALVVAANTVGNIVTALLLHRGMARAPLLLVAYLVMAATGTALLTLALPAAAKLLLAVLFTGFGGLLPAAVLAGAALHAPSLRDVPTVAGASVQGANLGNLLGAPAMAAAVSLFGGWAAAPALLLGCCLVGIGLTVCLAVVERRLSAAR
ncbi:MAG: MFS transporter [Alphaproteobacteria bacterium]|nr:MFS transporter [Alphaproteobacteria bacterium]